jgi:glutaredoxin
VSSNLPPGVSGNEYEIAGPDHEREEERTCSTCGVTATTTVYSYDFRRWFSCDSCDAENNLDDELVPDPDLHAYEDDSEMPERLSSTQEDPHGSHSSSR